MLFRSLFSRLGVFPGTFDLEAAEAVGGAGGAASAGQDQAGQVIDTLGSLVDASLIRDAERAGRPRFSLLETIREYARERLRESGQWTGAHDRHAAHFLKLAEAAQAGLESPSQVAWLDRLEAEHDNLSTSISWLLDQGQPGQAGQLTAMTWQYWWLRGHTEESAQYGEVIIASGELPPDQLGYAQIGLSVLLILSGDKARAQVLFEQALALFRRLGDKRGIAITTSYLGHLATLRGDYGTARKLLTQSLASPQDLGDDDASIALMYNFLGQIPLRQGDNDAAARLFSQGLAAARRVPDRLPLLISLYDLAYSSQAREDLAGAAGFLREGLSVANDARDESSVGYYLQRLAALARQQDDPDRAVHLLAAADALLQSAGTGWLLAYAAPTPSDDDTLPRLRSRMGDATFQQAWAVGAAMGCQRAVEYALRD